MELKQQQDDNKKENNELVFQVRHELENKGWIHLLGKSYEELELILGSMGELVSATDIRKQVESNLYIHSDIDIPFHSEDPKAKYLLWYCISQAEQGGETELLDFQYVVKNLPPSTLVDLRRLNCWLKDPPKNRIKTPILQKTNDKELDRIYYVPWAVVSENRQVTRLQLAISEAPKVKFRMEQGDIVVLDNHRILHSRRSFRGGNRLVQRYLFRNMV